MLLIWLIISRLGSNHDPKFFTFVEGHIRDSQTTRCEVITFSSCCLVPRIRNSVLSGLSFNLSISIQFCRSRMQDCIDDAAAVSSVELPDLKAKYWVY